MKKLDSFFDKLTMFMLYIGMTVLCTVIVLVVINIVGRSFFHFAIGGINEIVQYGILVTMSLGIARTGYSGSHVVIKIVLEKLPDKARRVIACIDFAVAAVIFFVTVYVCCKLIPDAMNSGLVTAVYKVPYYLIYGVLAAGLAVSGLVFIVDAINAVAFGYYDPKQRFRKQNNAA